jgi:uroporphyrinogen-III decarboxylase
MKHDSDVGRILAALKHKPVDRVPNWEILIEARNVDALLESRPGLETTHLPPKLYVQLAKAIGMDAINYRFNWDFGIPGLLKDWPDLEGAIAHPDYDEFLAQLRQRIDATRGTGLGVCFWTGTSFSHTYNKLGFDNFMYKLYDDPEFVERVMDLYADHYYNLMVRACEEDISFCYIGDDLAGKTSTLVSPAVLERYWFPRAQRIIEPAIRKGIPMIFHCDGFLEQVIPYAIKLGFSAVDPIEPYGNDIYRLKRLFGKDVCLVGNIDIAGVLAFGTPDDVAADVREHIERLSPGSGYVLCSSHSIIDDVPPENFWAMIETGHATIPTN